MQSFRNLLIRTILPIGALDKHDRPPAVEEADLVLLCWSIDQVESLTHIKSQWWPFTSRFFGDVPIMLLRTKSDVHSESRMKEETEYLRVQEIAVEIGAVCAISCSAKTYWALGCQPLLRCIHVAMLGSIRD